MAIKNFFKENMFQKVLFVIIILMTVWTIFNPYDRYMWFANFMVAIAYTIAFLVVNSKVQFSKLAVILVFIHLVIILLAAKYTYENFYPFELIKDAFGLNRNYFDRLGHFFQGVTPVILMREIFLKGNHMKRGGFFFLTLVMFTLGISGAWELLEYVGSEIVGKTPTYTEAMQGDMWDAQADMMICTIGAILSLLVLHKKHDKSMENQIKEN